MSTAAGSVLGTRQRTTLGAVCDALMPRLDPRTGDNPQLFALGASDVGLADAVEHAMTALSERQKRELGLFLRLLDTAPFMLVTAGRASGFTGMNEQARERALLSLANSPIPVVRTGFQALKRLATFLFYSVVRDGDGNATWAALGYDLPTPAKGVSALTTVHVTQPTTLDADVCVIGSGAAGGVVAARLAAAGRTVIVLEAGPADQAADFDQREVVGMQRLYLDRGTTASRDLGVAILAGSCIGGGTSINWQTSLRTPDYVRDEWIDRSGLRVFGEQTFSDALDAVSRRICVGTSESARNGNNAPLERGCTALGLSWQNIARNSRGCDLDQCGFCVFGCRVGGKQSTANTYLADAQRDGRTTIIASCRADRLRIDRGRVVGVQATGVNERAGVSHPVRVNAKTVVVAAGGLETPAFLLRSGIEHAQLGRNLYLHPTTAVAGRYDEPIRGWIGAPQTVLCDEYSRRRGNYGYRLETAPVHPGLISLAQPWYGARDHRTRMQQAAHVSAFIVLTRDRQGGRVTVDREGRTVVDYTVGRMERELLQEGIANASRVHWAAGAAEIHTLHSRDHTFRRSGASRTTDISAFCHDIIAQPVTANRCAVFSAHQMGTARMGTDRRTAVCDESGQVHGVPGVYVADTSLFPASSGVNPMLTVMALAHVIGARIASLP
jgi:choline dehydrogenase-like flavoprotein